MRFSRRHLASGEEVVLELKPHWSFFAKPLASFVLSGVVLLFLYIEFSSAPSWVFYILLAVPGLAGLWLEGRLIRWWACDFVVTNNRIVQRSGVLSRQGLEIRLQRINQLYYQQSLWQRPLRTGKILVEVGGDAGTVVFDHVRRPYLLVSVVNDQISELLGHRSPNLPANSEETYARSDDTPPAGHVFGASNQVSRPNSELTGDAARRLIELDDLRRRGILSEEEFAVKKAELLRHL